MQIYKPRGFGIGGRGDLVLSPTQVSGLALWLEADRGVTLTSGKVSTWADQSGNGRDFTQSTASVRPTVGTGGPNNLPYIIGGGTGWLNSTWTPPAAGTAIFVMRNTNATTTSPTGQIDTIFTASGTDFAGLRFESYNYYNDDARTGGTGAGVNGERYLEVAATASGAVLQTYRNGDFIGGLNSSLGVGQNEWVIASVTWSSVSSGLAAMRLLANADGGLLAKVDIAACLVYNSSLSTANRRLAEAYLSHRYALQHYSTASQIYVAGINSLTEGYTTNGNILRNNSWMYQLINGYMNANGSIYVHNEAVSGSTLLQADGRASDITGIDNQAWGGYGFLDRPKRVLWLWGGTNDVYVDGLSASDAFNRLVSYVTNRKNSGNYDVIYVMASIPRGVGDTRYAAYNTAIVNGWSTLAAAGAKAFIDLTQSPAFNSSSAPSNSTYYFDPTTDQTHLKPAGANEVARICYPYALAA